MLVQVQQEVNTKARLDVQEIYWEAEQEARRHSELDAGLVPMEGEGRKRMHRVSLRPASALFPLPPRLWNLRRLTVLPPSFGDTFSPRLLNFSSKCFFSLAQTLHVADKVRPAESIKRIQLGLSSQSWEL